MFLWTLMKFWNIWEMKIESLKTIYRQCWIDSDCERKSWNCPTAQKMKFSIKDFIIKCDQIRNGDWPTPLSPYPHPVPPPPPLLVFLLYLLTESFNFAEISWFFVKFIWNEYSGKKHFDFATIYCTGINFSTGGSIKNLPHFKFSQIYMYHMSLKSYWA